MWSTARVLALISLRNIVSHRVTSLIVGSIIAFGTFLVVLGTALLDSVEVTMKQSVTSSLAGDLQVYAKDAKDDLALFGGGMMGNDDIGTIPKVGVVRRELEALPNVAAVIPMGGNIVNLQTGNVIDETVTALRHALARGETAEADLLQQKLVGMADELTDEYTARLKISARKSEYEGIVKDLERVKSPEFWAGLKTDRETTLGFLDTHLAPLFEQPRIIYLRNLGTDLSRFTKTFDRFQIVEGQNVPEGERGFLFSKKSYEDFIKNYVARELDRLQRERKEQGKTIANDPTLKDRARQLPTQYQRVVFDILPEQATSALAELREYMKMPEATLGQAIQAFLQLDDTNFDERYAWFYAHLAPKMQLYLVKVGDTVTLGSYTKSGYGRSQNVKVYGIFEFKGLESSDLAGSQNLVDIMTFRELYGVMTAEKRAELRGIREAAGIATVNRDDAEAALFGGDSGTTAVDKGASKDFDEFDGTSVAEARKTGLAAQQRFSAQEIDDGLALNAAVILKDPSKLQETQRDIDKLATDKQLNIKSIDWQKATGIVGQLIVVIRVVLYVAIFIIFLVALVIINNSMVMATMERVAEIGTMRAIGAQRRFVLLMFLLETVTLGALAGGLGALGAAALIEFWGSHGIPAGNDFLVFLFSGPRLYPTFGVTHLVTGIVVILAVSIISTLYPARIATRIQPIVAMQGSN